MMIECENCFKEFEYDATRNEFEPVECPSCGFINYVMEWEDNPCINGNGNCEADRVDYGDYVERW